MALILPRAGGIVKGPSERCRVEGRGWPGRVRPGL